MVPFEKKASGACIGLLVILFSSLSVHAQQKNPLINSGEILKKGVDAHEAAKYKDAVNLYKQIPRSDTNYSSAIYEMAYSYYADSQFDASYKLAAEGMKSFPDDYPKFSMLAGNVLDDMGKNEEALVLYDEALKKNPQSEIIYFNKALVLMKVKKEDEAMKTMQECIMINPYYSSAHFFLGQWSLKKGNLVPAMLAFKTYLLIAPSGKYVGNIIGYLSSIAKMDDEVLGYVKNKKPSTEDKFNEQQEILISKIALDRQYKLKADLEDQIVRQIQVVDEKLEYNRNDKGFFMQYYVPFYSNTFKDGDFETMIFSIFSGLKIKDVESWNKKHKKDLEDYGVKAGTYFNEIRTSRKLIWPDRANAKINYLYQGTTVTGKGAYSRGKKNELLFSGPWEFYYDNGGIKAKGNFDPEEKKQGTWEYFYENGQLKEKSEYKNDQTNGPSSGWFDNGNRWYTETLKDGLLEGVQNIYYYNDNIKISSTYKAGKKNGLEKSYNTKGELEYTANYVDDKLDGETKYVFSDGKLSSKVNYKADKAEGPYKSYYENGKVNTEGEFINHMRQGLWTSYYSDGTVKEKTTYKDNEIMGEFTEYFEDGKLSRKGTYNKKKIDGKVEDFDDDGKLYSDAIYEKGRLKEINFYDKKGNNISNTTTRRGAAEITFFSPLGIKTSVAYFNKDGDKDGNSVFYYPSGKISSESSFKDGSQEGKYASYYVNRKKATESEYKDGEEDGYSKGYFTTGQLKYEGWMVKGEREQHFIYYNMLGDIVEKEYYLSGNLDGYSQTFNPGNKLEYEYKYSTGWLEEITQYDTMGNVLTSNKFKQGKGPLVYKYASGVTSVEGAYDHYYLSGIYKVYFFNGTPLSVSYYKGGEKDSTYKNYFFGGKLRSEGKYKDNQKDGVWKYYYENGQLSEEELYKDGKLNGLDKSYNPDGTLDKIINYKDGDKHGEYKIYGDNNQLAVMFYYKEDDITGYSYEDNAGKLVTTIPLKGGNGKVVAYYKNGAKSVEMDFVDYEVHGTRKLYYSNGKPYVEGTRDAGYDQGVKKVYYPNGNLWKEENYIGGNLQGPRKEYYSNGKLMEDEILYNDYNNGVCKYYDEQGKLKQTRTYYYGTLLNVK